MGLEVKASVRAAFVPLTVKFEGGYINWMFPDVKDLVSTGFGLLLDPFALCTFLPWKRADGSPASRDEMYADWLAVKNFPNAARLGHKSVEHVAKLRLTNEDMDVAVQRKLAGNESILQEGFPEWDDWPADAQLATLSMAWAVGPNFWRRGWPKLTAALRVKDFATAAIECFMSEAGNPGIVPRNIANKAMYSNASGTDLIEDLETLYWPRDLASPL